MLETARQVESLENAANFQTVGTEPIVQSAADLEGMDTVTDK